MRKYKLGMFYNIYNYLSLVSELDDLISKKFNLLI